MVTATPLFLPQLDYGLFQTAHSRGRSFTLPAGKRMVYCPPMNRPNSDYLNMGVSAIYRNASDADSFAVSGCCMANDLFREYSEDHLSNKPLADWTEAETVAACADIFNNPGHNHIHITTQFSEAYGANVPFAVLTGMQQQYWIDREFGARQAARGGTYHGHGYGGDCNAQSISEDLGNTEMFRAALLDPAQALSKARSCSENLYFDYGYQHHDGLIQTYASVVYDFRKFQLRTHLNMDLWRGAMQGRGGVALTRKLLGFGWYGECQPFHPNYYAIRHQMPAPGGRYEINSSPRWPFEAQLQTALTTLDKCDIMLCWESGVRCGTDPTYHRFPNSGIGNNSVYYGTGGIQYANDAPSTYVSDRPVCFVDSAKGYQDAPLVAAEWVGAMHAHAGFTNRQYVHSRRAGSTTPVPAVTGAACIDAYQQERGIWRFGGAGNKAWIYGGDFSGDQETRAYEIPTPLGTVTIEQDSHTCQAYLLNS